MPLPPTESFADVMAGLDAGDQEAARRLYERFIDRLVVLAAKTLDKKLGARVDPESVAVSVFESFFDGHQKGQLTFHNWGMVLGLLSHITFRKCLNRNRDRRARKRDESGVVAFEDWRAAAADPGPDQVVMLKDLIDRALTDFDQDERAVLDHFLGGATVAAVAQEVRLSTRTVHRVIERFRKRLDRLLGEAD
ncbi:MAG TPA: ECF-type sigma factor [Gemmataceae bacterium]|jgi:DNA-directed RNA polymerase specialized sigma24 family protein|nr:ECF-type sigma factor [Gemmataceae bacterium]